MKKKKYRLLNLVYGGVSGLLTGLVMLLFFIFLKGTPAMLFMKVFKQMEVFALLSKKLHVTELLIEHILHFIISIGLGIVFALLFHRFVKTVWNGLGVGFLFGIVWWILTPFYLLPFFFIVAPEVRWQDLTMFELVESLMSHLCFGLLLGLLYALFSMLLRRQARDG